MIATADGARVGTRRAFAPLPILLALAFAISLAILALHESPAIALAPLALVAAVSVIIRPQLATWVFLGMLYLNIPVIATKFYGAPYIVAASAIALLLIPLVTNILRREPLLATRTLWWMLAFLVALLLSAVFAQDRITSLQIVEVFLTEGLLLYVLVTNVIRSPNALRQAMWVLILAGMLMGAMSVYQEQTHTYTNNYAGLAQVNFGTSDPSALVENSSVRPRLAGPIGEKNRYAQILLVLFPLALFRFWRERSPWLRALALVATFFIVAGMFLSFSRGGAVALLAIVGFLVAMRYIGVRGLLLSLGGLIVAVLIIAPSYFTRLESIGGVEGLLSSDSSAVPDGAIVGRTTAQLAALSTFLAHPIVGAGPGNFFTVYSQTYANEVGLAYFDEARRAHNMYLETAADDGLLGLSAMLGIMFSSVIGLWRVRRYWLARNREYADLATALLLSVLGYMISAVFLHLSYERYFYLVIALANAGILVLLRQREGAPDVRESLRESAPAGAHRGIPRIEFNGKHLAR